MTPAISRSGGWALSAAGAVAVGVALAPWPAVGVGVVVLGVAWVSRAHRAAVVVLAVLVLAGMGSAMALTLRSTTPDPADLPGGVAVAELAIREDTHPVSGLAVGVLTGWEHQPWNGPRVAVDSDRRLTFGDVLVATGRIDHRRANVGDERLDLRFVVADVQEVQPGTNLLVDAGNRIRGRVREVFRLDDPRGALMAGFLIGDTDRIPVHGLEDLRRAGLAHYVAVSGSNVALFLGAVWILAAPLAIRPVGRALIGLLGLVVFVVATRWEPSVVRASVMASIPLVGGPLGVSVDGWTALGVAGAVVLLVSPALLFSIGFQLSVLATIGVMLGVAAVEGRRPRWLWLSLGATVGAQVLVAPLVVAVFGTIPLVAPIANLVAGPLVATATIVGLGAVVVPLAPLARLAEGIAGLVFEVAEAAAAGPQLSPTAAVGVAVLAATLIWRPIRPLGVAALILVLAVAPTGTHRWPTAPRAVVLDVGQGDGILIQDPSGAAALIDGGRDPRRLDRLLRSFGVDRLDVAIATHGDDDHVGGLTAVLADRDVGELVVSRHAATDAGIVDLIDVATEAGVPVAEVTGGFRFSVGSIPVQLVAPNRRFASDNDGSIVLVVGHRGELLLPGDIGAVAQAELPAMQPDVLVVPHHGAATTDLRWLDATVRPGSIAVLSYGPNTYGHPHPDVVGRLEVLGAIVRRTEDGHVEVPLG